jgi:hypothetical protein
MATPTLNKKSNPFMARSPTRPPSRTILNSILSISTWTFGEIALYLGRSRTPCGRNRVAGLIRAIFGEVLGTHTERNDANLIADTSCLGHTRPKNRYAHISVHWRTDCRFSSVQR